MEDFPGPQIERFVHTLMITGGWLMELMSGLSVELPKETYPEEDPWAVVFEMLCGTIGTALHSAEPRDLQRATELIDLAASRAEEHLRLGLELSDRMGNPARGIDGPTAKGNGLHLRPCRKSLAGRGWIARRWRLCVV
jgi:hypothetical protein